VIARLFERMMRKHAEGADLSSQLHLPRWIEAVLSHDRVAYPLHAVIGSALNGADGPPSAAGLEWLKAAAHARSEGAIERVARGLILARQRAQGADLEGMLGAALVSRVTCSGRDVAMRRRQLAALTRAGMQVESAMPASDASSVPGCLLHPGGSCSAADTSEGGGSPAGGQSRSP
jgi:hypothetical protein